MSLRSRLVAGFVLVAVVLVGTDALVAVLVRRALIQTVDRRLEVARGPAVRRAPPSAADGAPPSAPCPRFGFRRGLTDLYVLCVHDGGTVDETSVPSIIARHEAPPVITADIARRAAVAGQLPRPFGLSGGDGYRAIATRDPVTGDTTVIAVSLRDTVDTFQEVVLVEALATLAVLGALALVAWWVLHLGVRPLDQMAETADAIAAGGDLSRRVQRAEPRTEAGRLGLALNTMLGEIERAFEARRASEDRLRRFVADASHELRTPLTSIRGYAELWRQGGLVNKAAVADAMRRMEQEAARMGVLVDDMLLLARLDQGRPLEALPVDLGALAADAVADARAVEPGRPISLDAPNHLIVTGDEGRLRQVLANLLANTRVHTPRGTPVRVRLQAEGPMAVLDVEDDGPGLGPDPGRAFERFHRADPARARASGGTGLGLAIVAAVTAAHGGRASAGVTSTPGSGGARIRVELPVAAPTDATPTPPAGAAVPDPTSQFA